MARPGSPVRRWHSGGVNRFLATLVAALLVLVGCARQAPQLSTSPSPSAAVAPVIIGATSDQTTKVLAELYAQALVAKGRTARIVEVEDDANTLVSQISSRAVDVAPVFAWTAAQGLQVDSDSPDALVSDLAAALDGEVAVLQPSRVDRGWKYVSTRPGLSLDAVKDTDRVVGSDRWREAADGPDGLAAIYRWNPSVETVADSAARLAKVKDGAIGVFEATDPNVENLAVVADPLSMVTPDPQVALLRIELSSDDTVLDVIQQLHAKLDDAAVIGIKQRATTSDVPAAVAEWLAANPLQ